MSIEETTRWRCFVESCGWRARKLDDALRHVLQEHDDVIDSFDSVFLELALRWYKGKEGAGPHKTSGIEMFALMRGSQLLDTRREQGGN